ncbi:MAG: hypothetical protein COT38_04105 [Candidatus Omnitrophica bacterium CG08_land_8_20_14_0_20_41_16]|uniref:TIGR00374 family protein n=1 Tax=Candidatus Sherwoodlollariibacterium unditelluris TaxID=1974757 RepID=A0A2G9YK38_9BACT|nr:MAG: hypothetical protein COX41_02045 [Candidatus Omnitrophica bacterium CG23_combo_of_CG06-09_8_20_14_all_41_10]PIS33675.1 MAG: hypothetical protein COT38_04105 [Candidatus Omnitrophica bacterium CG08_land_8_20_14_0_20_41_16]
MRGFKKKLLVLFKVCVSIFILIYVFRQVDKSNIYRIIKQADKIYLLLAFFIFLLQYAIGVLRWQMLLKAVKINLSIKRVIISFSGSVFFSLLPFVSVIGGDIARGADLAQHTQRSKEVITTVFLDRLSGYVGLVLLAAFAFMLGDIQDATTLSFLLAIILVLVFILLVLFNKSLFSFVNGFFRSSETGGIKDSLKNIHHELHIFRHQKSVIIKNLLLSIIIQACSPIIWIIISLSLGIKSQPLYFFIFTPIVGAITMLPISVAGGLGIREYFTGLFFTRVGIHNDMAVAMSLVNSFFVIIAGVIGGLIYVFTVHHRRMQYNPSP